ncbi:MAG: hypothetical protein H0X33_02825 [Taibaiella sp.]|nr:hypothetical protein [Taibaiella sp.]
MDKEIEVRLLATQTAAKFCNDINSLVIYSQAIANYILTGSDISSKENVGGGKERN